MAQGNTTENTTGHGAGETGASTYAPLLPVPAARRAFGTSDAFALWFSLGIGLLVAQAGALLVPGMSLPHALAAIVIGTVIGVVLLALAGVVGHRHGPRRHVVAAPDAWHSRRVRAGGDQRGATGRLGFVRNHRDARFRRCPRQTIIRPLHAADLDA